LVKTAERNLQNFTFWNFFLGYFNDAKIAFLVLLYNKMTPEKRFEIFIKMRNFPQKSKFWSNIEILVKNRNFDRKSKFWSKIEILVKNRNFDQKSKFWLEIGIMVKNRNFGQKL